MTPKGGNKPKTLAGIGSASKTPKRIADLKVGEDIDRDMSVPCWNYQHVDLTHSGSWDWILTPSETAQYLQFLQDIQRSTWQEIVRMTYNGKGGHRKQAHHSQTSDSLCTEAKERLHALKLGELESVFRFRLGSEIRLWGAFVGFGHEFHILWWDRAHKVYPLDS